MSSVSLIIPAYNEEKYLALCLASVEKNAPGKFFEILVINNASTDRTPEIASSFKGVRVVHETKKGLTSARQRGFTEARGDILAYIDADTHMPAKWADTLLYEFNRDKNLACLSGPYNYYDIPAYQQFLVKVWYICAKPLYFITKYMATGGNFAIRKDVLEKMGGFDTSISFYGEDTNLARRAHAFGKVLFTSRFTMPTSARRFKKEGWLKTAFEYGINFFSEVIIKKPLTGEYTDVR